MSKFSWGHVLERFSYDLDGEIVDIVKYIPNHGTADEILYHCDELHESFHGVQQLLIAWITWKNLGLNQHALVSGICRALNLG